MLDDGLANLARVIERDLGVNVAAAAGAGAAGGLGAGLAAFLGARIESGIGIVLDTVGIDGLFCGADVAFTGEGRVDAQSASGKVASGFAAAAAKRGVPVILIAGSVGDDADALLKRGVTAIFQAAPDGVSEGEAMRNAAAFLEAAAERAMRMFVAGELDGPDNEHPDAL
jgi:glycerate kinase